MFAQLGYYICVPFAWLTRVFYSLTGSYGLALILFTLVVKLVILPFQLKGKKSMLRMNRMQGKMKDIQTRYANNKQRQQEEMANLYAQEGVNPMSGCLWSFLPFPILIALYAIIRQPLRYLMGLSMDTITAISDAAVKLGYAAAEGARLRPMSRSTWQSSSTSTGAASRASLTGLSTWTTISWAWTWPARAPPSLSRSPPAAGPSSVCCCCPSSPRPCSSL